MTRVPPKARSVTPLVARLVAPPVQGPWHAGPGPDLVVRITPSPTRRCGYSVPQNAVSRPIRCVGRSGALEFIPRRAWLGMELQAKSPRTRPPAPAAAQYRPFEVPGTRAAPQASRRAAASRRWATSEPMSGIVGFGHRGVAKLGIARALGARDRGFESRRPDHDRPTTSRAAGFRYSAASSTSEHSGGTRSNRGWPGTPRAQRPPP
jgi:hypothetical protein